MRDLAKRSVVSATVSLPLLILGVSWLSAGAARAQALEQEELEQQGLSEPRAKGDWNVTLGAGVAAAPIYPGAAAYRAEPVPLVSITYRDLFFLGPLGLGANVINWNGFRAGPVLGFEGGRDQDSDSHLAGLGDIQPSLTAGLFAAYRFGPFEVAGIARQAVIHTGNGLTGLVRFDYRLPVTPPRMFLIVGPDLGFADAVYDRTWFGVTPEQSAQAGLPVFTPGGGLTDVGLHASLTYFYTEHVLLRAFGRVEELVGDIAASPIVRDKTQELIGVGAAYHF
jgi:MipA family protein